MTRILNKVLKLYSIIGIALCSYGAAFMFWNGIFKTQVSDWAVFIASLSFFVLSGFVQIAYLLQKNYIHRAIYILTSLYLMAFVGSVIYLDANNANLSNSFQYLALLPLLFISVSMASNKALQPTANASAE